MMTNVFEKICHHIISSTDSLNSCHFMAYLYNYGGNRDYGVWARSPRLWTQKVERHPYSLVGISEHLEPCGSKRVFPFSFWVPEPDKTEVSRLTESSETNLVQNCFKTSWNSSTSLILSLLTSLLASFDVMMVHNYKKQHYQPAGWLSNCLSASTRRCQLGDQSSYLFHSKNHSEMNISTDSEKQTKHTPPLDLEVQIH